MIWRSNLTHQDYIKHDIQSMTTKFSIRPSRKTKMKEETNETTNKINTPHFNIVKTPKINIEDIVIDKDVDNDKIMTMIMNYQQDHINNEDEEMEEENELESNVNSNNNNNNKNCNDNNDDTIEEKELSKTINNNKKDNSNDDVTNQGVFLNFSSDLSPQTVTRKRKKTTSTKSQKPAYKVNGVNILNRKNLDSKTAIERMQRRRENHNYIERRRRDTINNIIYELSQVVPLASWSGQKPNKGNILKATLDYILTLQEENRLYKEKLSEQSPSLIPTLIPATTLLPSSSSTTEYTNVSNTKLPLLSSKYESSSSVTMNHSSPAIAPPSKNISPLSPIPVHDNLFITTTSSSSGDHSINNNNKKIRFIPIEMDGYEKAYNNTCHY